MLVPCERYRVRDIKSHLCRVFAFAGQTAPRTTEMIIHKQEKEDSMDQDDMIHSEVVISGI